MTIEQRNILKLKQVEFTINTKEYKAELNELSNRIYDAAVAAENEATIVSIFEMELFFFIKETLFLRYYPEKEKPVGTERHIAKGRIDSKIGALVIEFKHTSKLKTNHEKTNASNQIKNYLSGLYESQKNDYWGVVTDGTQCQFIRIESGKTSEGSFAKINAEHLDFIIRSIILLDKTALTPENLVKDFCRGENSLSKRLALCLYSTLKNEPTGRSLMLFNEWKELFRLAHDDNSKQRAIRERRNSLESAISEKLKTNDEEYLALYSLQTAYAIIIKIIAYKVISKISFHKSLIDFDALSLSDFETLKTEMSLLEEGAIFRDLGIGNLLEGDFFSWYSSNEQWNEDIGQLVQEIFKALTIYEDKALFEKGENVNDLFKDLFMHIIPDKVRHSLGEYYTPPWLADNLITESISQLKEGTQWKALDPCAGSGTFLTVLIKKVLEETMTLSNQERLAQVLERVKAIDLNPLAVLTSRINYFINISPLIEEFSNLEIPVYLGDSSYVPSKIERDGIDYVSYKIKTIKGFIEISLPLSAVSNSTAFSRVMTSIETDIQNLDNESIVQKILGLVSEQEKTDLVRKNIQSLADQFVDLEKNDWNGIWARIVTNFLTTANLGKFDLIVGNPPWIDWKNLPAGYRERIKSICIDRHLFSGDRVTGGINLNICALISNVAAQNWLAKKGVLAFLMPQTLLFQQTYEGFRNFHLDGSDKLYFQKVFDWTKAGHPFFPVTHKFLSFFLSREEQDYSKGISLKTYTKGNKENLAEYKNLNDFGRLSHIYNEKTILLGQANADNTIFSYAESTDELKQFSRVSGSSVYIGRDGIDFYPQELFLLEIDKEMPTVVESQVFVHNFQASRSQHKISKNTFLIETIFLYPLVRSVEIKRFCLEESSYFVPFPYLSSNPRTPLNASELSKSSPLLAKYFNRNKATFSRKTSYNKKIIGEKYNTEFYSLTRVGEYTYAEFFVAFRKDTKWAATVVGKQSTPWGEEKSPRFQSHAVSISQNKLGAFITEDEAHFICAVLNSPVASKYILSSSDARSFKVRPQIFVPQYDKSNKVHITLSKLSQKAHQKYNDVQAMKRIDLALDKYVMQLKG